MEGRHRDRFVDYDTLVPFDSGGKGRRVFPPMMQATGAMFIRKLVGLGRQAETSVTEALISGQNLAVSICWLFSPAIVLNLRCKSLSLSLRRKHKSKEDN